VDASAALMPAADWTRMYPHREQANRPPAPPPRPGPATRLHHRRVTTVLDRLEKAGYIRRRPDPGDRRRQLVETTEATAARDEEVFGDLIRGTRELLAGYTHDELLVIRDFLDRIRQLTAAHADALASHARPRPSNAETTHHGPF
jgi:DNA-binding PadR family transcriptional regulator